MVASRRQYTSLAILALGGQGGGVLANWILAVAKAAGYTAQGTSVPGVAQRTGTTIYYIEMTPKSAEASVLALQPTPGDIDIVIASELMEAGRAVVRGLVTDRTTLIASTHRIYAVSEKTALGDGRLRGDRVLEAARRRAGRFIAFDMASAATDTRSVISSVMLGALCASSALPFPEEAYEAAIRKEGKAVNANLLGFAEGRRRALEPPVPEPVETTRSGPTTPAGRALHARIVSSLPESARAFAEEGVRRLLDYQDRSYAETYLDRLGDILRLDDGGDDFELTRETARHLALWMAYEDTIRIADLKTRSSRFERIRAEIGLRDGQQMVLSDYLHPRLEEICDTLPMTLGRAILRREWLGRWVRRIAVRPWRIELTQLRWRIALSLVAALRPARRTTMRYALEQQRIDAWLETVACTATMNRPLAVETVRLQRLLKGYGETFERGHANFSRLVEIADNLRDDPGAAAKVRQLREAALADDSGAALAGAIATLEQSAVQQAAS